MIAQPEVQVDLRYLQNLLVLAQELRLIQIDLPVAVFRRLRIGGQESRSACYMAAAARKHRTLS